MSILLSTASAYRIVDRLQALRDLLRSEPHTWEQIVTRLAGCYENDENGKRKLRRDLQYLERWGYTRNYDPSHKTYALTLEQIEADWTRDDLIALSALRESFQPDIPYTEILQAILKRIERGLNRETRAFFAQVPPLTIKLVAAKEGPETAATRRKLEAALRKHQRVSFEYQPLDRQKVISHPDDEPVRLEFYDGHTYLWAYCYKMDRIYDYRVDRIVAGSVRILPQRAQGRWQRKLIDFQYRLSPKLAASGVTPRFPEIVAFEPQSDGSLIVTARGYYEFWIIREILRYGEQAEILSPDSLRAKMRQVVERMYSLYGHMVG
ncbi:MAG: WYL domain-containing protein [Chloroflexi bacterium]|nr:WYL domain-containing protein [Chloroflexota bacterium]